MAEVVFIDQGEMDKVPTAVREAFAKESGPIPHVALSDSSGTKVYGTSNHTVLKNGLDKALRTARRAMRDDMKNGTSPKTADTAAKPSSSGSSATDSTGDTKVTVKNGVKEITGAPMEEWTSSKGTLITARITRFSGFKITLVTNQAKTLTLNQTDLSEDSLKRLQEIINPQ